MTLDPSSLRPLLPDSRWPHIRVDANGLAWIDVSTTKVVEVVLAHRAWGWSPELIRENYPHLSHAQIHAALGYYFDHQDALDRAIELDLERADAASERHPQAVSRRALLQRPRAP